MSEKLGVATYRVESGVAVLTIDSPPVNALGLAVRTALSEGVARALADDSVAALVLICAGRTFFAGADVTEIGKPILPPLLGDVITQFENSAKLILAAMHGTALGGGLELALAAHYRVAVPSATVGLPEVALGLLPGAGGTQRVPRLIGVAAAVEMIGLGQHVNARQALSTGLIDAIVEEGELETQAIAFARDLLAKQAPLRRLRDLSTDLTLEQATPVFVGFRAAHPELFAGVKAAEGVLQAIEAAITLPFDMGIEREREISRFLIASPESAAQRHLFFAERAAAKFPGHEREKAPAIGTVGVVGDWIHAPLLEQKGLIGDGAAQAIILAMSNDGSQPLETLSRDATIVLVNRVEKLDALAMKMPDPGAVVGLSYTRGVAEIVVGGATRPAAALAAGVIARKLGWAAIFVGAVPGLVLGRLAAGLQAAISALLADSVAPADIRATGKAFGFAGGLLPDAAEGGVVDAGLEQRLVWPVLAEASVLVDEGAAKRSSDIDFAMVRAGLWPLWRGGPAFMAERVGHGQLTEWMAATGHPAQLAS
ncbi:MULTISPECIES: enoyl-CoA hydratase/isomerase family protein [unclassified Novosphingobium]|uniref:enoyl-CoA hydratase/isomerase family protein n=1 Tax=unclassified Novosphingobium TaxID=2644732 RepID=UPI000D30C83F|nr:MULTISPECIES: enoyl-CoA hydratase/isomerase family protein [unclassified Novosphingobium]PTR12570.1 enoyl-CoA hydratase/carnithine racemase [Novosphingobium sp. GV055]PUB06354.1 enoyl-CoA hydratase/carnithine racemase [Novosphingobium sp. GV061]PUB22405.1 enoyl-CoA hydratase/carnithine racemase [Novosphingobium sp. GV079]PUB44430.1 enoyl-CoA hydratase/carnithine racemase [Novosphingobium sp. GV027]